MDPLVDVLRFFVFLSTFIRNDFSTVYALKFNREQAYGYRLDIPSGTAIRFEPGEERTVGLVRVGGEGIVHGGNGFIDGKLSDENRSEALKRFAQEG